MRMFRRHQIRKVLLQRIGDMLANCLDIASKQLRHLMTIQPHCLVLKTHIQPDGLIWVIYYNLVFADCLFLSCRCLRIARPDDGHRVQYANGAFSE